VLGQTITDLELVVVDDGSTDNSLQVLENITDPRLQVVAQENRGAHAAINGGLDLASGRYLAILNSDDAFHPQRLERIQEVFAHHPQAGLVGSHIQIVDSAGKPLGVKHGYEDCPPWLLEQPERSFRAGFDLHAALLTENYWSTTSNFAFRRELYYQVGEFLPLRYTHDWDYALRLAQAAPSYLIPEPLVRYRVHGSNTIRENPAAMIFEILWILAVHLPQHTAETGFFEAQALDKRIDQLLYSIYAFGMERVLSVMLLQRLDADPQAALRLLDPNDAVRERYLDFLRRALADNTSSVSNAGLSPLAIAKAGLKKVRDRTRGR